MHSASYILFTSMDNEQLPYTVRAAQIVLSSIFSSYSILGDIRGHDFIIKATNFTAD